ncbi:branched-chain amino acid transport system substrate-binding protein [Kineococcus xinjiangensis]|uniref:Branched-chain amino acid transport system substrate-binding protein n=1 Tax=Kineococcus xinjiangensis TaxID=512762 RepID=A0A2S6IPE6_9ACTN|nr:branched-chain amino acid ABC transporter substrate-binding protein [Kineococcus xinjiangensis]PPK96078.1 branched-chain amino acid transport system substrate-binding protein [Kineococcus xinjiangensis]
MRPTLKFLSPVAAAALLLTACGGTTGGDTETPAPGSSETSATGEGGGGSCDGVKIGFFGALTGDYANLGQNIRNGVELALNEHNAANAECQVELADFDSAGAPDQAPGLATKAIGDDKVLGIVGPAFSGESKVANPLFAEAGLVHITPSATNPALAENGWETFFRVLGNDATQGPGAAKYIKDVLGAKKVVVIDDASEYGKGLADIVREDLGDLVVENDTIQAKQTDFSATVSKVRAAGADAVFFGGYYPEAGLMVKQLRDAGIEATFVTDDGAKDEGLIVAGGEAANGTIITCPCLPPEEAGGTFAQDYEKEFGAPPATYSAEGYDAAKVLLDGIAEGKTEREALLSYVEDYNKDGVTKKLQFDERGEPSEVSVWAYKVENGQIVPDQEINVAS